MIASRFCRIKAGEPAVWWKTIFRKSLAGFSRISCFVRKPSRDPTTSDHCYRCGQDRGLMGGKLLMLVAESIWPDL